MANYWILLPGSYHDSSDKFRRRKSEISSKIETGFSVNNVKYFGWAETIGGVLKICMVFGSGVLMYVIHEKGQLGLL